MDKKIKLTLMAGPFGDCTSAYDVSFPQDITVEQFVQLVLQENPKEWGTIGLSWNHKLVDYSHGSIKFREDYDVYKNERVLKAKAHGGWSLMDYELELVPKPKLEKFVDIFAELTNFPF